MPYLNQPNQMHGNRILVAYYTNEWKERSYHYGDIRHLYCLVIYEQALSFHSNDKSRLVVVEVGKKGMNPLLPNLSEVQNAFFDLDDSDGHVNCAKSILELLNEPFAPFDDLPTTIDASYEKYIINSYKKGNGKVGAKLIQMGYPEEWPEVENFRGDPHVRLINNPLDEEKYGKYRDETTAISVDTRLDRQQKELIEKHALLTFPEAGPRKKVIAPPNILNVAILVSGGIAPGINAVINAIMDRHNAYEDSYRNSSNEMHRVVVLRDSNRFVELEDV